MKKVKQGERVECNRNATLVREVRNGFSLQVTLEQRPECSEGMSLARISHTRTSFAGKGNSKYKCFEVRA